MAKRTPTRPTTDVTTPDSTLLESPTGRENDFGLADHGTLNEDEIVRPEITSRPRSEITGRHDEGSGANETIDGLDESEEALRHAAEDVPVSDQDDFDKLPVFDRAESERKI